MYTFILLGIIFEFFGKLNACVYITVSSLPANKLEINWHCKEAIETISVFDQDPKENIDLKSLAVIYPVNRFNGFCKTNITFSPEPFPGGWSKSDNGIRVLKSHCLYWTKTYFTNNVLHEDCFKIQPAWMFENKEDIKRLSLPLMFIPGTHNSATNFMKLIAKRSVNQLENFVLTQDQSVWNQLVYGIRFLDFRIGFYPEHDNPKLRFWINHDLLRIQPLLPILKEVNQFSKASPDEIIILDFHRFPAGFKTKNTTLLHKELLKLIEDELKDMIIPRPMSQTRLVLEDIWNSNKRIIICYSEDSVVWETPWLWNSVSQRWGNKQKPDTLEKFLDKTFRDVPPRKMWAAMAELTPTPVHILSNISLRSMADTVNRLLSEWFAKKQNWTNKANIVATDFFLGTNLINLAIEENVRRGKQN